MESVDCVVIGAGVIGLAVARRLAMAGREVIILEAEGIVGSHTSSRNSEVVHAGIYYPTGSRKARVCVEGRRALYRYCDEHGVPYANVGKVIVATEESEVPRLHALQAKAAANGVDDLRRLSRDAIERLEPAVRAVAGLFSPSTGIVDSHRLMHAFEGDAADAGAMIAFRSPVEGGEVREDRIVLRVGGEAPMALACRTAVNCAGLFAQKVARSLAGVPPETIPPQHLGKGNYYSLAGAQPFSHLVYPLPGPSALGVHVGLDLAGRCRFGPDLEWVDAIDYSVDPRARTVSMPRFGRSTPSFATGACSPTTRGSGPSSMAPASRSRTSSSRGRRRTASRASSTSTASSPRASPRRSPSRTRSRPASATRDCRRTRALGRRAGGIPRGRDPGPADSDVGRRAGRGGARRNSEPNAAACDGGE